MNKEKILSLIDKITNKKVKDALKLLLVKELKDIQEELFLQSIYVIIQECYKAKTYSKIVDLVCWSEECDICE